MEDSMTIHTPDDPGPMDYLEREIETLRDAIRKSVSRNRESVEWWREHAAMLERQAALLHETAMRDEDNAEIRAALECCIATAFGETYGLTEADQLKAVRMAANDGRALLARIDSGEESS